MLTYAQFRQGTCDAYRQSNTVLFGMVPTWGPLNSASSAANSDPQTLFDRIVNETVKATAAQTQANVDWNVLYGVRKILARPSLAHAVRNFRFELRTRSIAPERHIDILARHIRVQFDRDGDPTLDHHTQYLLIGAIDPSTLIATVLVAVLGVLCPPTAAFAAILEPVIAAVIKIVFEGLTKQYATGNYGGSQAFTGQLNQWAAEAAAA